MDYNKFKKWQESILPSNNEVGDSLNEIIRDDNNRRSPANDWDHDNHHDHRDYEERHKHDHGHDHHDHEDHHNHHNPPPPPPPGKPEFPWGPWNPMEPNVNRLRNGVIEEVRIDRGTTFVLVSYQEERRPSREQRQQVQLIVTRSTVIRNEYGRPMFQNDLKKGMVINATFSAAMTRSIPPQAEAFLITVFDSRNLTQTTDGIILNVDVRYNSMTVATPGNPTGGIRFIITEKTIILNRNGNYIPLSGLMPGQRVRVQHGTAMTASIPPQTTAYLIQVL